MTAHLINNSVRMAPEDPDYPSQWLVTYHRIWGEPGHSITQGWVYIDDVMSYKSVQPGYQIEVISNDRKEYLTWEVVNAHMFKPVSESNETYSGVVVCGCKLVSRRQALE